MRGLRRFGRRCGLAEAVAGELAYLAGTVKAARASCRFVLGPSPIRSLVDKQTAGQKFSNL